MDSTKALIAELHHLVSLNEERNGGPYQGLAAQRCVEAMRKAAAALSAQGEAAQPAAEGWVMVRRERLEAWGDYLKQCNIDVSGFDKMLAPPATQED